MKTDYAQLTEHAIAEVVHVVCEQFLFLSVCSCYHLRKNLYAAIRTCFLAQCTCCTLVIAVFVVWHNECATMTFSNVLSLAVFWILLCYLSCSILSHGNIHSCEQRFDASQSASEI